MDELYWIIADTIIFKPEFSHSLNNYVEIISQYKKIIFSNYNDSKITIETNNKHDNKYNNIMNLSKFNQPLSDSLSNLINLKQLNISSCFNQPLSDSLSNLLNLQQLNLGKYFNQPLSNSLSKLINLQQLNLGKYFNNPILNIRSNLLTVKNSKNYPIY